MTTDKYAPMPCTCRANGCNEYHLRCFCGCARGHGPDHPIIRPTNRSVLVGPPGDPYACLFIVEGGA